MGSSATEIAPGVHRLGSEWVNWYLVVADDQVTVVDTGLPGYYDQLEPALAGAGLEPGDVDAIVITHHHSDHVGCAERIRTECGARVLAPRDEAPILRGEEKPRQPKGFVTNLWRPRLMRFVAHAAGKGAARMPKVAEVEGYASGEELDVPGRPRTVATPGHSFAHHSLHFPRHGVLFTGDAMASISWVSGTTGPQLHPFGEEPERMPDALEALEPLEASLVAFGHGEPFAGTPAEAVARARELAS